MKPIRIIAYLFGVVILFVGCNEGDTTISLQYNSNSYNSTITSLSKSNFDPEKIFVGLKSGDVVIKKGDEQRIVHINKNNSISAVFDFAPDTLFVSSNGLHMIVLQDDKIVHRKYFKVHTNNSKYGVSCITADFKNRILYIGSGGCYSLDMNASELSDYLTPEYLVTEEHRACNALEFKNNRLFMISDYLCIKDENGWRETALGKTYVKGMRIYQDWVYAILENEVVRINVLDNRMESCNLNGQHLDYIKYKETEWLLGKDRITIRNANKLYTSPLEEEITSSAKSIICGNDVVYVPINNELRGYSSHLNLAASESNTPLACSNCLPENNSTKVITRSGQVLWYSFATGQYKYLYNISNIGLLDGDVIDYIITDNGEFIATKHKIFRVNNDKLELLSELKEEAPTRIYNIFYHKASQRLYIATQRSVLYFDTNGSKAIPQIERIPLRATIGVQKDQLCISDIGVGGDGNIYFLSLSSGLFKILPNGTIVKVVDTFEYGKARQLITIGNEIYLLLAKGVYLLDAEQERLVAIEEFNIDGKSPIRIKASQNSIYAHLIYNHGIACVQMNSNTKQDITLVASDLAVKSHLNCHWNDELLFESDNGTFIYDRERGLAPINIPYYQNPLNWIFGSIGGVFIVALIICLVFYIIWLVRHKQLLRYKKRVVQLRHTATTCIRKEMRVLIIEKIEHVEDALRGANHLYIKSKTLLLLLEQIDEIQSLVDSNVVTIKTIIDNNIQYIENLLTTIKLLPKSGTSEINKEIVQIESDIEIIKTEEDKQTIIATEDIIERLLTIEAKCLENIALYNGLINEVSMQELMIKLDEIREMVLNYKQYKKAYIRAVCERFVNKYPQLRLLSFMRHHGEDSKRFYLGVLFMIPELRTKDICRALGIEDTQFVNRARFAMREQIAKQYAKSPALKSVQIINHLYHCLSKN